MAKCWLYDTFFNKWFESQLDGRAITEKVPNEPNCICRASKDGWKMKECYNDGAVENHHDPVVSKVTVVDGKNYTIEASKLCTVKLLDEGNKQIYPKFGSSVVNNSITIKGRPEELAELRILKAALAMALGESGIVKIMFPNCYYTIPFTDIKIFDGCYEEL